MFKLWLLFGTLVTTDRAGAVGTFAKAYIEGKGGNMTVSVPIGSEMLLQYHNNTTGEVLIAPSPVSVHTPTPT